MEDTYPHLPVDGLGIHEHGEGLTIPPEHCTTGGKREAILVDAIGGDDVDLGREVRFVIPWLLTQPESIELVNLIRKSIGQGWVEGVGEREAHGDGNEKDNGWLGGSACLMGMAGCKERRRRRRGEDTHLTGGWMEGKNGWVGFMNGLFSFFRLIVL